MNIRLPLTAAVISLLSIQSVYPCTGITLRSAGGDIVTSRTVDWSKSKYESQYVVVPRGICCKPMPHLPKKACQRPHVMDS